MRVLLIEDNSATAQSIVRDTAIMAPEPPGEVVRLATFASAYKF